jgi:hypothetical protein
MNAKDLRRSDRDAWLHTVRAAVGAADGILEPAAKTLGVRPATLHRWLGEPELRSLPIRGAHWAVNDTHAAVRLVRGHEPIDIDVGIAPLIDATWSMEPASPETCCSCEAWTAPGADHGKVQIGFNVAAAAWIWLAALDRLDGWRLERHAEMRLTRGDWSMRVGAVGRHEPFMRAWVYFPRDDRVEVTMRLRQTMSAPGETLSTRH